MKIILEYDDFHPNPEVDCLSTVKDFVNEFPNILINLFTIPCYKGTPLYESKDWCRDVRALIKSNNIRIAVHGTYHTQEEYKFYDYKEAVDKLKLGESILQAAGIDYAKVFRGPNWGINKPAVDALCDLGYTHIYSHQSYSDLNSYIESRGVFAPKYHWNLKDEPNQFENTPKSHEGPIICHGHTHDVCSNGINQTFGKLKDWIKTQNPKFLGVEEYYE